MLNLFTNIFVIEGLDWVGKSSAIERVTILLESQGFKVVVLREPGGTIPGITIRSLLLNSPVGKSWTGLEQFSWYILSRALLAIETFHTKDHSDPKTVYLYDRCEISTDAYQMKAKRTETLLRENGVENPRGFFDKIHEIIFSGIQRKFVYLKAPFDVILERRPKNKAKDNLENVALAEIKIRYDTYEERAEESKNEWAVIDATKTEIEVANDLLGIILEEMSGFEKQQAA